jgi:hypothetical protein
MKASSRAIVGIGAALHVLVSPATVGRTTDGPSTDPFQFFAPGLVLDIDASLGLTMVLHDADKDLSYLVYVNRSQLDVLRGFFGGLTRGVLSRRVERQAPLIVHALRERLETGTPLDTASGSTR